jgi:hypothetical protein
MTELGRDLQKRMRVLERETDATDDDRARMRKKLSKRLGGAAIAASTAGSVSAYASRGVAMKLGAWLAKGAKVATVWHGVPLALAIGAAASVPIVRGVNSSRADAAFTGQAMESRAALLPLPSPPPTPAKLDTESADISRLVPPLAEPLDSPAVASPTAPKPAHALSPPTAPNRARPQTSAPTGPDLADTSAHVAPKEMSRPDDTTESLLEEYALISRMHRALGAPDQDELSRAVDEHGRRFPSGVLAEERDAMRAMLGCIRASTPEEAQSLVSKFLARYPRSLHAARVEASCASRSP